MACSEHHCRECGWTEGSNRGAPYSWPAWGAREIVTYFDEDIDASYRGNTRVDSGERSSQPYYRRRNYGR